MELVDLVTLFHSLRECTDLDTLGVALGRLRPCPADTLPAGCPDLDALRLALVDARQRALQDERAATLESRVREHLIASTQLSLTLTNVLGALLSPLDAEAAALIMQDGATHRRNRVLAGVGLHHWMALERDLATDVAEHGADRLMVPFRVSADRYAALELIARPGSSFAPTHAALCARAVCLLQPWLSGIVEGGRPHGSRAESLLDAESFEARALAEFDRASRFRVGVGLLVVDTRAGLRDQHALVLGPLVQHVRRHLRAKDAVGRLRDGRLGVLVVETDERGLVSVTQRIGQAPPRSSAEPLQPCPTVGTAWFPTAGRDFGSLVAAALDDLHRHAVPLLDAAGLSPRPGLA